MPPDRRRIGYVFQDARLFPHLDVRQNLMYGRRMNRLAEDPAQYRRVIDLLDIGHLLTAVRVGFREANDNASRSDARCWPSRDYC